MNLTDSDRLKLLYNIPLMYKDICLIYSPSLFNIAKIGLDKFYECISLLLISKPSLEDDNEAKQVLDKMTDFDFLIATTLMDPEQKKTLTTAFEIFTQDDIIILPQDKKIILGDIAERRVLDNDSFYEFQSYIGAVCSMDDYTSDRIEFLDSDSPQVRAIKMKMIQGRKDLEKIKKRQKDSGGKSSVSLSDLIASIPIGTNGSYNLESTKNLTYYAFQDQLKRMGWYEEFNINSRAALAGAKIGKDKLSHWIKNMTFK